MIIDLSPDEYVVEGKFGGGGGGGSQHKPVEANDTLASKQTLRMMFALCEGAITSVDNVYVNGTLISGFSASFDYRLGLPSQTAISGYPNVEAAVTLGFPVQLPYNSSITKAVTSSAVDAVRVGTRLNGLSQRLGNGDTVGYSVTIQAYTRPDNTATWTLVASITKSGKASQPYTWDTRINRPSGGVVWEIKLIRITADDTSTTSSITFWDSFTEIQDATQTYPNTAILAITFTDSTQLGSRIPSISCDITAQQVKVPHATYYNPVTRVYTGVWNYAWALSDYSSSTPAWHIFFILNNARAGLGIAQSEIDLSSVYELAKYCDGAVSDGKGGFEPRFALNNQFYNRENAPTFLTFLLASCNANLTTANGLITLISDRPTAVSKIIANSQVIDGIFDYSSAELAERFSSVNVTYNDPNDKGNTTTITETDSALVSRYGLQAMDVVLVGCTSEGQARRKARWVFETQSKTTDILNFKIGYQALTFNIGDVVAVLDDDYANVLQQCLVVSTTSDTSHTTIALDRSVVLPAGTLSIMVYGSDGFTLYTSIINQTNVTTDTITTAVPLATNPNPNSPVIIKGAIIPREWRITAISANDGEFTITCTAYDSTKYARIDTGITVTAPTLAFTSTELFSTPAVSNITVTESFRNDGIKNSAKLVVKWDWDVGLTQKFRAIYDVLWRRDNLPFTRISDITTKETEINGVTPGTYEFVVYAYNVRGIRSPSTTQIYSYRTAAAASTLQAPLTFYVAGTVGLVFDSPDLSVTWTHNTANDSTADILLDYQLEVWTADGVTKKRTVTVPPNANKSGQFVYTYQQNVDDFGTASRTAQFKLYSRDITGNVSTPTTATFNNPVPAAPVFTVISGIGIGFVSITPPADMDVDGYIIYRSTSSGFTPGAGNLVYDGADTYISLQGEVATPYYYRVAAYDRFGKTGLNIATQQSSTTLSNSADTWTKTGLTFTVETPTVNTVYWTSGTIIQNGTTTYTISSPDYTLWTSGIVYIYFNPIVSTTTLQHTTSLATAVASGNYPLATYAGGNITNLKGGDGSAFISGSQIIAGSVGASQLIAGSAVITGSAQIASAIINTAHIVDGNITDAKIGNTIQSTNFNAGTFTGWKIDKTGNLTSYGALGLYDSSGNVVMTTGAAAAVQWDKVSGANKANDNATVGGTLTDLYSVPALASQSSADMVVTGAMVYTAATGNLIRNARTVTPTSLNTTTDVFTSAAHGFKTTTKVTYTCTSTPITGLVNGTAYFAILVSATTFKLATTNALALAGTAINFASATITAGSLFTYTPDLWRESGYSVSTQTGSAKLTFTIADTTSICMVGLNSGGASVSDNYTDIDFALYQNGVTLYIYQSAVLIGTFATDLAAGNNLSIIYTGTTVTFYRNGAVLHVASATAGLVMQLDSSFYSVGSNVDNLGFGVYAAPTLTSGSNISGRIHAGNIDTYIANAAINNLMFDRASGNKLQVITADIVTAAVDTLTIAGDAVTVPAGAAATGSASVAVDGLGYPVIMIGSVDITSSGAGIYTVELLIDGSIVQSSSVGITSAGATTFISSPSTGSKTYSVRAWKSGTGDVTAKSSIVVLVGKR